jgi:transposase
MPALPKGQRHPAELRERAVRTMFEHQDEYPSQWKAIESIAQKLDLHRETLRCGSAGLRSTTAAGPA